MAGGVHTLPRNAAVSIAMNGAQSLLQTLVDADVEVCFTDPGTSEMHFVAALDQQDGMRGLPLQCRHIGFPNESSGENCLPARRIEP